MAIVPFTSAADGSTILINSNAVQAVIPTADNLALAAPNPSSRVLSFAGPGQSVEVLGSALAIVTALGNLGGTVPLPIAQSISGPTPFSGPDAYLQIGGPCPFFEAFAIPNDPTAYTRISFVAAGDTIVVGAPAAVAALLNPAPGPGGSGRVILEATFDPTGAILLQQSDLGLTLAPTVPHVPGQGYFWSLTGAVPFAYTILTASPAGRQTIVARQVAPGSPDFVVAMYRPSRTYAAGRCGGGGGAAPQLALQSVRTGVGLYDLTVLTTLAPVDFAVSLALRDPNRTAALSYTGPATFSVDIRDLTGVNVDCDFSACVTGIDDGTGNEGFEPLDDFMQIVIIQG